MKGVWKHFQRNVVVDIRDHRMRLVAIKMLIKYNFGGSSKKKRSFRILIKIRSQIKSNLN